MPFWTRQIRISHLILGPISTQTIQGVLNPKIVEPVWMLLELGRGGADFVENNLRNHERK